MNLSRALVVGVSQSGAGVDINCVLEQAKNAGAYTVGITNEPASEMAQLVDETLLTHGGRERSVAATKTYTGQLLMFYMLARALSDTAPEYDALPDYAARALTLQAPLQELVERYVFMENCVVVGRGLNYCNAYELALKLMETCYVVAERFSSADFFHGPLAMIERHFPVLVFAPPSLANDSVRDLLLQLNELNADTLVITSHPDMAALGTRTIKLPVLDEFLTPIPYIIPGQLFAALLAAAKGLNPDAPRSLSKVTRTL